jgi:hypothetical protein
MDAGLAPLSTNGEIMTEADFNFEVDVLIGKFRDAWKRRINTCHETGEPLPGHYNHGALMQQFDIRLQLPATVLPPVESMEINHGR